LAIVQISRITQRKGLEENLPQLAGAEFGWSIDTRQLYIGNGTLAEGAPVIGNTEILTEFSDILAFNTTYTYKGEAAGYTVQTGATPSSPITQSLQSWFDQWASVTDFGAVGDGVTDDTDAINRALYQLYCREINPQIRRALFFPAGVYVVSQTIVIPPFATLYGEGADNSIIQLTSSADDSALRLYVARTGDSLQQTGVNIGSNGAILPQRVTITNMAFESLDPDLNVFYVQDAENCSFNSVSFMGPLTQANLSSDVNQTAGVVFGSTPSVVTNQITFDRCTFSGTTYGTYTDQQVEAVTFSNSKFDTLYQGISLGTGTPILGGPTGFRIMHNMFDNIYAEGIIIGAVSLNASGYNIFYDVANSFGGTTNPTASVIDIGDNNNVSIGDMFQRSAAYSDTYPRINLNNTQSIGFTGGEGMSLGSYNTTSAVDFTFSNNVVNATVFAVDTGQVNAFQMPYRITRGTAIRVGMLTVASDASGGNTPGYDDSIAVETGTTGFSWNVAQSGTTLTIEYTTTNTGTGGTLNYSLNYFNV